MMNKTKKEAKEANISVAVGFVYPAFTFDEMRNGDYRKTSFLR
jgi:hypothetical protein